MAGSRLSSTEGPRLGISHQNSPVSPSETASESWNRRSRTMRAEPASSTISRTICGSAL
nr:hypothetical protein [Rubellimicrobium thermophilum]